MGWFLNRKISTKLILGFATMLVLTIFLGVFALIKLAAIQDTARDIGGNILGGTRLLGSIAEDVAMYRRWEMREYISSADPKERERAEEGFRKAVEQIKRDRAEYEKYIDSPVEQKLYENFSERWTTYTQVSTGLLDLIRANKQSQAYELLSGDSFKRYNEAIEAVNALLDFQTKSSAEDIQQDEKDYSAARLWIIVVLCTCVVLGALIAIGIARLISKPVQEVGEVARQIASGDLTGQEVVVKSTDEVGQLGKSINEMHGNVKRMILAISENAKNVASASEKFSSVSQQISANSEETSAQASAVSAATEEVNRNLQTVATATEEMSASIQEIAKNATEAAKVAGEAMKTAAQTNAIVGKLGDSSAQIGQVIKVITSIAQKTDLLALNATVEAARAGEVGAGFAVVANEVKELAKQTASATEDISRKIETIQVDAKGAVEAIKTITGIIDQVNAISSTIATAVEEQSATTSEMSRNLTEAAKGSTEVAQNITGVAQAAQNTSHGATDSQKAAQNLADMSTQLRELVAQFKIDGHESGNSSSSRRRSGAPPASSESYQEDEVLVR